MEKEVNENTLYGIIVWDDGLHTMCIQSTADYVRQYGAAIQGKVLVDNLSWTEADVFMKLLPRDATLNPMVRLLNEE